mmetsp:Transcript_15294/g.38639  ORF Transcript_15294/g.38639 Transcript_15294/m.38639 type:complete len:606 (-) Transcript_15294:328-2145(-)
MNGVGRSREETEHVERLRMAREAFSSLAEPSVARQTNGKSKGVRVVARGPHSGKSVSLPMQNFDQVFDSFFEFFESRVRAMERDSVIKKAEFDQQTADFKATKEYLQSSITEYLFTFRERQLVRSTFSAWKTLNREDAARKRGTFVDHFVRSYSHSVDSLLLAYIFNVWHAQTKDIALRRKAADALARKHAAIFCSTYFYLWRQMASNEWAKRAGTMDALRSRTPFSVSNGEPRVPSTVLVHSGGSEGCADEEVSKITTPVPLKKESEEQSEDIFASPASVIPLQGRRMSVTSTGSAQEGIGGSPPMRRPHSRRRRLSATGTTASLLQALDDTQPHSGPQLALAGHDVSTLKIALRYALREQRRRATRLAAFIYLRAGPYEERRILSIVMNAWRQMIHRDAVRRHMDRQRDTMDVLTNYKKENTALKAQLEAANAEIKKLREAAASANMAMSVSLGRRPSAASVRGRPMSANGTPMSAPIPRATAHLSRAWTPRPRPSTARKRILGASGRLISRQVVLERRRLALDRLYRSKVIELVKEVLFNFRRIQGILDNRPTLMKNIDLIEKELSCMYSVLRRLESPDLAGEVAVEKSTPLAGRGLLEPVQ